MRLAAHHNKCNEHKKCNVAWQRQRHVIGAKQHNKSNEACEWQHNTIDAMCITDAKVVKQGIVRVAVQHDKCTTV